MNEGSCLNAAQDPFTWGAWYLVIPLSLKNGVNEVRIIVYITLPPSQKNAFSSKHA